jgi:hypothetical protein
MDILIFVLTTLGLGMLCSLPALFFGRLLAARGIVREKPAWVAGGAVCTLFAWRLWFPQAPLAPFLVIGAILLPLGAYRADLWTFCRERKIPQVDEFTKDICQGAHDEPSVNAQDQRRS